MVRFFDPEMDRRLQRALLAAARSALGHRPRRTAPALSAAGHDRRRCLRLRSPRALATSEARLRTAKHVHHAGRTERPYRRDRRMDATPGLPRSRVMEKAAANRRQSFSRAIPIRRSCRPRSFGPPRNRLGSRNGWSWRSPKASSSTTPSRALSILRRLKTLGVKIAMDDFGTGYASLSSLQSFPFDKIKIDRTFVSGVDSNQQSAAIVRAVIGLEQRTRTCRSSRKESRPRASGNS